MYNILVRLLHEVRGSDVFDRIVKIAESSEENIKVKLNRQDIENLLNPKEGIYERDMKEITLDLKDY